MATMQELEMKNQFWTTVHDRSVVLPRSAQVAIDDRRSRRSATNDDDVAKTKKLITEARRTNTHGFIKTEQVVDLVKRSILNRGALFNDGLTAFVFLRDNRVLLRLEPDELGLELLLRDYGLFPTERLTQHVIDGLRLEAHANGRKTEVHAFSFYRRETHTVYVYDFNGGVYRLSSERAEHVDNGADGVLFMQNPRWTSLHLTTIGGPTDWRSWPLAGVRFADGATSESDQKSLVALWILTLFFPQLFPTRIILAASESCGVGGRDQAARIEPATGQYWGNRNRWFS